MGTAVSGISRITSYCQAVVSLLSSCSILSIGLEGPYNTSRISTIMLVVRKQFQSRFALIKDDLGSTPGVPGFRGLGDASKVSTRQANKGQGEEASGDTEWHSNSGV